MKFGRLACFVGIWGVAGCSGKIDVGVSDGGSGGAAAGDSLSAGTSSGGSHSAGAPSAGGSFSAGASSVAGAPDTAEAGSSQVAGAPGATVYCGSEVHADEDVPFAPTSEVAARVEKFLFAKITMPGLRTNLPTATTREWAGDYALSLLTGPTTAPLAAGGMTDFIDNWWPGASNTLTWSNYFTSTPGTLTDLLTSQELLPNGAGLLTDPSIYGTDAISHRGYVAYNQLFCAPLPPPPAGESELGPPQPGVSRRAQVEATVAPAACKACHSRMDPIGDSLEHFAADGSYRSLQNGVPIDSAGAYETPSGATMTFSNVRDLGAQLAKDCSVAQCVTQQMMQTARLNASLPVDAASDVTVTSVAYRFAQSGYDLRTLVQAVVQSNAFLRK